MSVHTSSPVSWRMAVPCSHVGLAFAQLFKIKLESPGRIKSARVSVQQDRIAYSQAAKKPSTGKRVITYNDTSKPNAQKSAKPARSLFTTPRCCRPMKPVEVRVVWVVVLIVIPPLNKSHEQIPCDLDCGCDLGHRKVDSQSIFCPARDCASEPSRKESGPA